ncbi:MAG: hypothetical protein IJ272_06390 [Clostridia bacterium]|nr:hypothetical protein [Clostridia bacterium]
MQNMCSYGYVQDINTNTTSNFNTNNQNTNENKQSDTRGENTYASNIANNDFFSINGDRLEVFGISINIDDLIILIMLFFMFRENEIDYSIIIILALILFDQS